MRCWGHSSLGMCGVTLRESEHCQFASHLVFPYFKRLIRAATHDLMDCAMPERPKHRTTECTLTARAGRGDGSNAALYEAAALKHRAAPLDWRTLNTRAGSGGGPELTAMPP